MRVLTVVGARPQFIKAGPVSAALKKLGADEISHENSRNYDENDETVTAADF